MVCSLVNEISIRKKRHSVLGGRINSFPLQIIPPFVPYYRYQEKCIDMLERGQERTDSVKNIYFESNLILIYIQKDVYMCSLCKCSYYPLSLSLSILSSYILSIHASHILSFSRNIKLVLYSLLFSTLVLFLSLSLFLCSSSLPQVAFAHQERVEHTSFLTHSLSLFPRFSLSPTIPLSHIIPFLVLTHFSSKGLKQQYR